jgi:hypothetical protein
VREEEGEEREREGRERERERIHICSLPKLFDHWT